MSRPPYVFWIQSANAVTDSGSVISSWWNSTLDKPLEWKPWAAANPRSLSRAPITTVMPCVASCLTISCPMPLLPPVTTATVCGDHQLHPICKSPVTVRRSIVITHDISWRDRFYWNKGFWLQFLQKTKIKLISARCTKFYEMLQFCY